LGLSLPLTAGPIPTTLGVADIFAVAGVVFARLNDGTVIALNSGGLSFPILAPNGAAAAPSFSFALFPTAGVYYDPGIPGPVLKGALGERIYLDDLGDAVVLSDSGNVSNVVVNPVSASLSTANGTARLEILFNGEVSINSSVGLAGQVPTSAGPGLPTIYATPAPLPTVAALELVAGTGAPGYAASTNLANGAAGELIISGSPGAIGQVPTSAGPGAPIAFATPATSGGAVLTWGAENVSNVVDTRVMPPGFDTAALNNNTPKGYLAPRAGTFRNLTARHNQANGNGNSIVYRLRINGALTALQVTLATGAIGSASNLVNPVAVAQGDLVELVRVIAVAVGSGVLDAMCAAEFI
jgi:hypothetical protein